MNNDEFQIINRNDFMVTINSEKIVTPEFTRLATSRYRLTSEFILQKQCPKCNEWYNVAKYENDNWLEIWKEEEYKRSKTGSFPTYCTKCSNKLKVNSKNERMVECSQSTNIINKNNGIKKDTVLWDTAVYKYIMIQAVLQSKNKNTYINDMFREIIKKNPIPISFENKK